MMKLRSVAFAGVLLLLTNCSGPHAPLNPPQLIGDAETDMSLQLFMQATILLARYYGYQTLSYRDIQSRSLAAGYSTLPFMSPITVRAVPALYDTSKVHKAKLKSYVEDRQFSIDVANTVEFRQRMKNSIGYKGLLAYYIKTGLRASQIICRNYLLGLDEKNQYVEFLKSEFGVFYTLADGVLLAVSANGTLLHSFALARDAAENGASAYEKYRFLSIDRQSALSLVEAAQNRYAAYYFDQINHSGSLLVQDRKNDLPQFFTFADALNAVSTIEFQCTRSGIRNLLTQAVKSTPTNIDVDRNTGTIMFKSDQNTLGTSQSKSDKGASREHPSATAKNVAGPETPTSSGHHGSPDGSAAPGDSKI
jgi:hypothetical protein